MAAVGTGVRWRRRRWSGALRGDLRELGLELGDAVADEAAVLFQLGLALAAHAARAALAGQVGPGARQARQGIFHAGQGYLQHGLAGLRPVGEDFEDDLLPVNDGEAGFGLPVALDVAPGGDRRAELARRRSSTTRWTPGTCSPPCSPRKTASCPACSRSSTDPSAMQLAVDRELERLPKVSGLRRHVQGLRHPGRERGPHPAEHEEAQKLKDEFVSVEHLLLGLLDVASPRA
jgi:hypothetical protein